MASLFLVVAVVLGVNGLPGKCGHAARQNFTVPTVPIERDPVRGRELARGGSWLPIRMKAYYDDNLDISSEMEERLRTAVDGALAWFQSTILVKPITAAWSVVGESCDDVKYSGAILTDSFDLDYVFFITSDGADNGLAGSAIYCLKDAATGQPILGTYYFNAKSHEDATDEAVLSTTIHEMTHALVFSDDLFTDFVKSDGSKYSNAELYVTETVRGVSKLKLALPNIVAKARAGFGCSSLNGLELESDGGEGTAGVHWEKRIMYNDFMVADSDITDIAYTDVSMALYKDSGWYDINYKFTSTITWGYHEGCSFFTSKCIVGSTPITADFCATKSTSSQDMCDFMHLRKGTCNLGTVSDAIPTPYQYFGSASEGGTDMYLDYCPVVKADEKGDCRSPDSVELNDDYGEEAGLTSRCVTGTYSKSDSSAEHAGCHKVTCSGSTATLTIGDVSVQCPATGGDVQVTGMSGVVHCPSSDVLCRNMPCVNNCNGLGYCQASQCVCTDGTSSCKVQSIWTTSNSGFLAVGLVLFLTSY